MIGGSMVGWKFWKVSCLPSDVRIIGVGHRVKDDDLKYVLPSIDHENEPFDLIGDSNKKGNPATLYCGKAGTGKSTLMGENIWQQTDPQECEIFGRTPETAVIFSPKTFRSMEDFDYALPAFERIDMTKKLPSNIFENHHAFVGSLLTAVYSTLTMRGMMVKNVETQLYKLLKKGNIQSWEDFETILNNAKKRGGEFDKTVLESIEGDIQFLKDAGTEGTLDIDWSDLKKNYVLDFGTFGENRIAKVFFMEYYLRIVFNHRLQNILAIDEVHRLLNKGETSILSEVLREGRTSVKLHLATQNFSDVPPSNMHFGSIFAHETQNGDDFKACGDEFVKDYWKMLRGHQFIDLTHGHQNQTIPIYQLDPTRLNKVRDETRLIWEEKEESEQRVQQDKKIIATKKNNTTDNLNEKVLDVLKTSDVVMYGYEIARKIGMSPKGAVQIRQPLRNLVGNKNKGMEVSG